MKKVENCSQPFFVYFKPYKIKMAHKLNRKIYLGYKYKNYDKKNINGIFCGNSLLRCGRILLLFEEKHRKYTFCGG